MKNFTIETKNFSFAAIATILTGRVFARSEFSKLANFLAPRDGASQVIADRESKWIPWLIVQFPQLIKINIESITDENAMKWLKKQELIYREKFKVRAIKPARVH